MSASAFAGAQNATFRMAGRPISRLFCFAMSLVGIDAVEWGVSGTYLCSLASTTLSRQRRVLNSVTESSSARGRALEAIGDEAVLALIVEVGLCDSHEFQWLGTCHSCSLTACGAGYAHLWRRACMTTVSLLELATHCLTLIFLPWQ